MCMCAHACVCKAGGKTNALQPIWQLFLQILHYCKSYVMKQMPCTNDEKGFLLANNPESCCFVDYCFELLCLQ